MNHDQENPFNDKSSNIFTKYKDFNNSKRFNFFPELNESEEDYFQKQKRFYERTNRSQSHYQYHCRPEFVPKPKPKKSRVRPSPMNLKRKFVLSINESDHCYSPLESEDELSIEQIKHDSIQINNKELAINSIRRTLNKLKASPLRKQSKDYEQVSMHTIAFNKKPKKSVFTKTIKGFIEDEKESKKNAFTVSSKPLDMQQNISILSVLEQTAGNMPQFPLIKCKSTIL